MTRRLTRKQRAILAFVCEFRDTHPLRFPPTRQEIAARFGFAPAAAHAHLIALERKGAIRILSGLARGIEVLAEPAETTAAIAAGDNGT
jgi:repressor LexA